MATKRKQPAEKREANLSVQQMQAALPRLERRLAELDEFQPETVKSRTDPRIGALGNSLDTFLVNIFGFLC